MEIAPRLSRGELQPASSRMAIQKSVVSCYNKGSSMAEMPYTFNRCIGLLDR